MLTTRATENHFGWAYLTRVHTGHFEPDRLRVMWLLPIFAPLDWRWTVGVMIAGQAVLVRHGVATARHPLRPAPRSSCSRSAIFCFSPLTLPAFSWLSAAIIWLPLMIAVAGLLRQHTLYLRTLALVMPSRRAAWLSSGWPASRRSSLPCHTWSPSRSCVVPDLRLRLRVVLLRAAPDLGPLERLRPCRDGPTSRSTSQQRGHPTSISGSRSPGVGASRTSSTRRSCKPSCPGSLGGPWELDSGQPRDRHREFPTGFEWGIWILAGALWSPRLVVRRGAARALDFAGYLPRLLDSRPGSQPGPCHRSRRRSGDPLHRRRRRALDDHCGVLPAPPRGERDVLGCRPDSRHSAAGLPSTTRGRVACLSAVVLDLVAPRDERLRHDSCSQPLPVIRRESAGLTCGTSRVRPGV